VKCCEDLSSWRTRIFRIAVSREINGTVNVGRSFEPAKKRELSNLTASALMRGTHSAISIAARHWKVGANLGIAAESIRRFQRQKSTEDLSVLLDLLSDGCAPRLSIDSG